MSENYDPPTKAKTTKQGTSALEWCVAAIGGLLFLFMVSFMAIEGLTLSDRPAEIDIVTLGAVRQGNGFAIRFNATNVGDQTASSVVVRASLYNGDREVETARATIDYLPGRSRASGGFWFSNDPTQLKLQIRAESYLAP